MTDRRGENGREKRGEQRETEINNEEQRGSEKLARERERDREREREEARGAGQEA